MKYAIALTKEAHTTGTWVKTIDDINDRKETLKNLVIVLGKSRLELGRWME
jgi:hypothetical protein